MLHRVVNTELHPPGLYTAGWLLNRLGAQPISVRVISILAAVALSGAIVVYARQFVPLWGAALVGLVSALGWQFVAHGWELRPYAVFALASVLFALALERVVEQPTRRRLILAIAVVAIGVMTHYFFVFTLAAGLIWLGLLRRWRLMIAAGLGAIPLVAWLPATYKQYHRVSEGPVGSFQPRAVVEAYATVFYRSPPSGAWGYVVGLVALGAVLAGAVRLWRMSEAGRLCALCAVFPVAAASLIWLVGPQIFIPRNFIGAAPFAAIAVVTGLASLPRPVGAAAVAVAGVLVIAGYVATRGAIVPDYDLVAHALVEEGWRPQDPIVLFGPRYAYLHTLDWYLPGSERLELASLSSTCDRVYVVAVGGRGRVLTQGLPSLRVKHVVIARVSHRQGLAGDVRRGQGSVFATRSAKCARVD